MDLLGGMIGVGVGAFVIVGSIRRMSGMAHRRELARRADYYEAVLREARAAPSAPLAWRIATSADAPELVPLELARADDRALVSTAFVRLGELVTTGPVRGVLRAYADAAATTFAVVRVANERVQLELRSYATDARFATLRAGYSRLAAPPTVQVVEQPRDARLADLVREHHGLVARTPLVRIATLDALLARMAAVHDENAAWRAAQPPDELLEADLRAVLRADYERLAPIWRRRLRDKLPTATVRR